MHLLAIHAYIIAICKKRQTISNRNDKLLIASHSQPNHNPPYTSSPSRTDAKPRRKIKPLHPSLALYPTSQPVHYLSTHPSSRATSNQGTAALSTIYPPGGGKTSKHLPNHRQRGQTEKGAQGCNGIHSHSYSDRSPTMSKEVGGGGGESFRR